MTNGQPNHDAVQLIQEVMDAFSRSDLDHMFQLLHDDVVVEMPFEGGHDVDVLDKTGFRKVMELVDSMFESFTIEFDRVLALDKGQGVVAEYHGNAIFKDSGVRYANRYCGIFITEGGRIRHWREYDHPVILQTALAAHFQQSNHAAARASRA